MNHLEKMFEKEYEFYLESVKYTRKHKTEGITQYTLNCTDTLSTSNISKDGLQVSIKRSLQFDPDEIYSLSVVFGVLLKFSDNYNSEIDKYDWSDELAHNGNFFLSNIMPRISHLIAEITASYGQIPVITPPSLAIQLHK